MDITVETRQFPRNPPSLLDVLASIDEYRKALEKESRFDEAKEQMELINRLKDECSRNFENQLSNEQDKDLELLEKGHNAQILKFNDGWDARISAFEAHADHLIAELTERHENEFNHFYEDLPNWVQPVRPHWSKALLELRDRSDRLGRVAQYHEAKRLCNLADEMEIRETETWRAKRNVKAGRITQRFKEQQKLEFDGFLKRLETARTEMKIRRDSDFARLLKQLANAKQQLANYHRNERRAAGLSSKAGALGGLGSPVANGAAKDALSSDFEDAQRWVNDNPEILLSRLKAEDIATDVDVQVNKINPNSNIGEVFIEVDTLSKNNNKNFNLSSQKSPKNKNHYSNPESARLIIQSKTRNIKNKNAPFATLPKTFTPPHRSLLDAPLSISPPLSPYYKITGSPELVPPPYVPSPVRTQLSPSSYGVLSPSIIQPPQLGGSSGAYGNIATPNRNHMASPLHVTSIFENFRPRGSTTLVDIQYKNNDNRSNWVDDSKYRTDHSLPRAPYSGEDVDPHSYAAAQQPSSGYMHNSYFNNNNTHFYDSASPSISVDIFNKRDNMNNNLIATNNTQTAQNIHSATSHASPEFKQLHTYKGHFSAAERRVQVLKATSKNDIVNENNYSNDANIQNQHDKDVNATIQLPREIKPSFGNGTSSKVISQFEPSQNVTASTATFGSNHPNKTKGSSFIVEVDLPPTEALVSDTNQHNIAASSWNPKKDHQHFDESNSLSESLNSTRMVRLQSGLNTLESDRMSERKRGIEIDVSRPRIW